MKSACKQQEYTKGQIPVAFYFVLFSCNSVLFDFLEPVKCSDSFSPKCRYSKDSDLILRAEGGQGKKWLQRAEMAGIFYQISCSMPQMSLFHVVLRKKLTVRMFHFITL